MVRRVTPDLSESGRAALIAELLLLADQERRAELDKMVHVATSYNAGMTLEEIAAALGVSRNTAHRWKDAGEAERKRREA